MEAGEQRPMTSRQGDGFGHHGPVRLERQRLTLLQDLSSDAAPTQPEAGTRLRTAPPAST